MNIAAVTMLPASCAIPVPTRLRMPSASVMMREIRTPDCVESKKRIGSRLTCSLDGSPLVHATDGTFATGRIALVTAAAEAAEFGNVRASG